MLAAARRRQWQIPAQRKLVNKEGGRRGQKEEEGGSKKKKQPEAVGWWSRNNKVSINVYGGACLLAKGLRDAAVLWGSLLRVAGWLAGWLAVLAMRQGVEAGSSAWLADARRSLGGGTRRGERQKKNEGKAREQAATAALLLACDAAG